MNRQNVINKVYTRTYYLAEGKKEEMPSLATMQASQDNNDILSDYLESAMDRVKAYIEKRLPSVSWVDDTLLVESNRENAEEMIQRLDRAIEDYLVEELVYRWVSDNQPKMADPSLPEQRLDYVKTCVTSLAPNVRRRATTMGI